MDYDLTYLLALGFSFFIIITSALYRKYHKIPGLDLGKTSLLIDMYSKGMKLQPVSKGTIEGLLYFLMVTEADTLKMPEDPRDAVGTALVNEYRLSQEGTVILEVSLPTPSLVHIAGLGIKDADARIKLLQSESASALTRVELEGDFPDYFLLFCTKSKDIELRQVLDPATMQFLVDFCQREDWELLDNSLYFVTNNDNSDSNDDSTMVKDAQKFIKHIMPILQRMMHSETASSNRSQRN